MLKALATEGNESIRDLPEHVLYLPRTANKPRNLAKTVTVE